MYVTIFFLCAKKVQPLTNEIQYSNKHTHHNNDPPATLYYMQNLNFVCQMFLPNSFQLRHKIYFLCVSYFGVEYMNLNTSVSAEHNNLQRIQNVIIFRLGLYGAL